MIKSKCSEFVWIQKDGTPIHVRQMDDKHLLNTIRLLRRSSKRWADQQNTVPHYYSAEEAACEYQFEADDLCEMHPTWDALQFERRVRGLAELSI